MQEVPPKLQSDHLLLLVGSNPLPNAVAACLLLAPGGTAHLLRSPASDGVADNLGAWLRDHRGISVQKVETLVDEGNSMSVASVSSAWVSAYKGKGRIGLHYTGGTKVMSVQSDQALAGGLAVMSYLDPYGRQLCFDAQQPEQGEEDRYISLGSAVALTIDDIGRLHGVALKGSHKAPPYLRPIWDALTTIGIPEANMRCMATVEFEVGQRRVQRAVFDVLAVSGYQLFAFTCPQARAGEELDHAALKRALFACYERARRIGGDEARAALVCPPDCGDPAKITEEMVSSFNLQAQAYGVEAYKVFATDNSLRDRVVNWIQQETGTRG